MYMISELKLFSTYVNICVSKYFKLALVTLERR